VKDTVEHEKQATYWRKYFTEDTSDKESLSKI
jgi:hypothetical protein